jgi:CheY-like chemotaxis protein
VGGRESHARRRKRILLVDDIEDNCRVYGLFLRTKGFDVSVAAEGHDALAKTRTLMPDLVVMDLAIPGIDGWEVTRRLKADRRTRRIPVVAVTGHVLAGAKERASAAGCDAFLTKPCLPDELLGVIQRILRAVTPTPRPRG